TDAADPLVNWDERDLDAALEAAGLANVRVTVEEAAEERLITAAHLERWFGTAGADGRPSYRERLLAGGLTEAEADKVETLFRRQLLDQSLTWRSQLVYIHAVRRD